MQLKPKYCPICHESNKQDADFCFKCNWVISKKGMQQVKENDEAAAKEAENQKKEIEEMKIRIKILDTNVKRLMYYLAPKMNVGEEIELFEFAREKLDIKEIACDNKEEISKQLQKLKNELYETEG
jgi:hypothetical protein